jgi:hypothetical protein
MYTWLDRLTAEGKAKQEPLFQRAKLFHKERPFRLGRPFAESKEAIGGFFLLEVANSTGCGIAKEFQA